MNDLTIEDASGKFAFGVTFNNIIFDFDNHVSNPFDDIRNESILLKERDELTYDKGGFYLHHNDDYNETDNKRVYSIFIYFYQKNKLLLFFENLNVLLSL